QAASHTIQPTLLVHEAYLRLVDYQQVSWQNRAQFFGLAAKMIRDLLVDHLRQRQAMKRGGGQDHLSLSIVGRRGGQPGGEQEIDLLALDEALKKLAATKPQRSQIVELRYFGGLTVPETAEVMGISETTVEREWRLARAWLYSELSRK